VLAVVFFAGGGWALWKDRMDRDSGLVSIGTTSLHTETSAIVAKLRGDGPSWLYGSTVLGNSRVRVTSETERPVFVGIARTADISRYLDGAGYATIAHLATNDLTTHPGRAVSTPPSRASIWAASTEGTGEQTLRWKPRGGDWSIVLMNADASAGVSVRGDASAKMPLLPWLAAGLLVAAAALAFIGGWQLRFGGGRRTTDQRRR
jgi:hypothetical protein